MNEGAAESKLSHSPHFVELHLAAAILIADRASTKPSASCTDVQNDPVTVEIKKNSLSWRCTA